MSCPYLDGDVVKQVKQGLEAFVPHQLIWYDSVAQMYRGVLVLFFIFIILLIHTLC